MSKKNNKNFFERFANKITAFTGSSIAFISAVLIVVIWAISGPVFHYSETWQLVINTGTTIITFLMVFLIQKSQNKDSKAIQLKLNELIAAHEKASNRMVDIEDMDEKALDDLHTFYEKLSDQAVKENNFPASHSIDDAEKIPFSKIKSPTSDPDSGKHTSSIKVNKMEAPSSKSKASGKTSSKSTGNSNKKPAGPKNAK